MMYPMVVRPLTQEEGGGYCVYFPDLPGCMSDGETVAEAVENGLDALESWMSVQQDRNAAVDEPFTVEKAGIETFDELILEIDTLATRIEQLEGENRRLRGLTGARIGAVIRSTDFKARAFSPRSHIKTA